MGATDATQILATLVLVVGLCRGWIAWRKMDKELRGREGFLSILPLETTKPKKSAKWDSDPEVPIPIVPLYLFGILGSARAHIDMVYGFFLYREMRSAQADTLIRQYVKGNRDQVAIDGKPYLRLTDDGQFLEFVSPKGPSDDRPLHDQLADCIKKRIERLRKSSVAT